MEDAEKTRLAKELYVNVKRALYSLPDKVAEIYQEDIKSRFDRINTIILVRSMHMIGNDKLYIKSDIIEELINIGIAIYYLYEIYSSADESLKKEHDRLKEVMLNRYIRLIENRHSDYVEYFRNVFDEIDKNARKSDLPWFFIYRKIMEENTYDAKTRRNLY